MTNITIELQSRSTLPPADNDYVYEHAYKLVRNDITLTPNGLLIYIGPDLKSNATISGHTNNVVTVTTTVSDTYTFTFNANTANTTNKTITIYYVAP